MVRFLITILFDTAKKPRNSRPIVLNYDFKPFCDAVLEARLTTQARQPWGGALPICPPLFHTHPPKSAPVYFPFWEWLVFY